MITLTYQFRLKLNRQQTQEVEHILSVCKSVYNYALAERKHWYNSRKSLVDRCSLFAEYIIPANAPYPNYNNQAKNLTIAKKTNPDLKSVNAQVLQQTLKTLDKAFSDMKAKGFGFPRFKKHTLSFVFPAMLKNCLGEGKVKLPQLGWLRIKQSRDYPTGFEPKQARIVKKATGYYLMIAFQSQESCPDAPVGKVSLGIDAGIESFIATDRGELIKAPKFLLKAQSQLKLLQRRLKHKIKGSNNWLKLQNKIAKIHEKVANTRRDRHFKLANYLCDLTDNIFVEDINFVSWSRGIVRKQSLDSGIGQFINEILPYVCWKRSKFYLKVDKNGTSQECSNCGTHTGKKHLNQRVHSCQYCGYTAPRDVVSAEVIRNRGLIAVGHTVSQNACGDVLTGFSQSNLTKLVKCL
ncbi:transposase IS891/IS1136/IS1341 family [Cyanobacterium stanieri PCC 7202]|uniref:Transposase IS891/IS1136/IS1341 family n=1 Tax=Cyanobacterium stanieri (strain ATCC 29140 / PCC 7202) TaxID=292563 RepID=K9YLW3_CYASC|nr:transposase IS891/IS1136/IS1341 family [Cyanobacterium stanieri PCC 7202]